VAELYIHEYLHQASPAPGCEVVLCPQEQAGPFKRGLSALRLVPAADDAELNAMIGELDFRPTVR
jgi:hypothetical protein